MVERVKVVFPAKYPGYAFEVFSLITLKSYFGYSVLRRQFNRRLPSGKWVQFDGLLERDGLIFILEARFTKSPVHSSEIELRLRQARACGYDGLVITSRSDPDKSACHLDNVMYISMKDLLNNISREVILDDGDIKLNTCLESVLFERDSIRSKSAVIVTESIAKYWRKPIYESENIIRLPNQYEIWVRRIGALEGSFTIENATVPLIRSIDGKVECGLDYLWFLEDLMSGMANLNIIAMIETGKILSNGGLPFKDVIIGLRMAGFRAGISGTRDILKMLVKLGIVEVVEKRYCLTDEGGKIFLGKLHIDLLKSRIANWAPVQFMSNIVDNIGSNVYDVMSEIEKIYNDLFPYARNTFNKNRTQMLINLAKFSQSSENEV